MKKNLYIIPLFITSMLITTISYGQDYSYQDVSLLTVIEDLEEKTNYRFLYRESFVRGVNISMEVNANKVFENLEKELEKQRVGIKIDEIRKQVLIYEASSKDGSLQISINGFVVDAATGERLPYATVAWRENGRITGINTNNTGAFSIKRNFNADKITLLISYVGYTPETVQLDLSKSTNWDGLSIRLTPNRLISKEIVVKGVTYYNAADSVFDGLAKVGAFSPLGEDNTIRALQTLPAVNTNTAINEGINIRGSSADGFKVLLDGISIYNQSHLFGLLDSFNSDVLKSTGFFYDVAPAQFEAPTGGTLALITRTGSMQEFTGMAGISNTSFRGTLEGPVVKGKSSFLISGRQSYMNSVNWLNNSDLIEFGLDINRPSSAAVEGGEPLDNFLINTGNFNASFYDLHAKFYTEGEQGNRFQISGYMGEDDSEQSYERCFTQNNDQLCPVNLGRPDGRIFRTRELETVNRWGNNAFSALYQYQLGDNGFSESSIGISDYDMNYKKDDFTFQRENNGNTETVLRPFGIDNSLRELKISQSFDWVTSVASISSGIVYFNYQLEYFEDSFKRVNFSDQTSSSQLDLYFQTDFSQIEEITLQAGSRLHYFSDGKYLKWSPRVKMELYPNAPLSFSMGYSKNHQFLNQIGITNANTADLWVAATGEQPPTESDLFSAGLHLNLGAFTYFQVEGYLKNVENMRLHELETRAIPASFETDLPWYFQNRLFSQGLEFMLRQNFGKINITQTYTLSSVEIENPRINDGNPYNPDWDRRHQYYALVEWPVTKNMNLNASWTFASGNPNELFTILQITQTANDIESVERLKNYNRLDLSISYTQPNWARGIEANLYLFNVLDRDNVWYREFGVFVQEDPSQPPRDRFTTTAAPVDVFDLGFQPSFNLSVHF